MRLKRYIDYLYEDNSYTHSDAIQDLKDDAKSINIKLDFSINDIYVNLYHGTSKKSAAEILKSGFFRDGFFFSKNSKGEWGDSVHSYANIRGKQDGSGGKVLKMKVDPKSFHINTSTSELESDGDLWLHSDGIWRNKKEENNVLEFKTSSEISVLLDIKSIYFIMNFVMSMLWHKYYTLKIRNKNELFSDFKSDLQYFLDYSEERPRWLANKSKTFKCTKNEFVENIKKFINLENIDILLK